MGRSELVPNTTRCTLRDDYRVADFLRFDFNVGALLSGSARFLGSVSGRVILRPLCFISGVTMATAASSVAYNITSVVFSWSNGAR